MITKGMLHAFSLHASGLIYLCLGQLLCELGDPFFSHLQLCKPRGILAQAVPLCRTGGAAEVACLSFQLSAARAAGAQLLDEVSNQRLLVCMHCCEEVHLSSMLLLQVAN